MFLSKTQGSSIASSLPSSLYPVLGKFTSSQFRHSSSGSSFAKAGKDGKLLIGTTERQGEACSICVAVKAGSRFEENADDSGVSHFLRHVAFKMPPGSSDVPPPHTTETTASHELIVHKIDFPRCQMATALSDLTEALGSDVSAEQVAAAKRLVRNDIDGADPLLHISDELHAQLFFEKNGLQNPVLCPTNRINEISATNVNAFKRRRFQSPSIAIGGVGMKQKDLVDACRASGLLEVIDANIGNKSDGIVDRNNFTSFDQQHQDDDGKGKGNGLAHIAVGFHGPGISSENFTSAAVLQVLLGGGGSFSAGGPGKGLLSRLYANVLMQFPSIDSAVCIADYHASDGIFGVAGSSPPSDLGALLQVLLYELTAVLHDGHKHSKGKGVTKADLQRAKEQLKSMMYMGLESRVTTAEDIARQLVLKGSRESAADVAKQIDRVSLADLKELVSGMIETEPGIAIYAPGLKIEKVKEEEESHYDYEE